MKRQCLNDVERSDYQNDYVGGEIIFNLIPKSYQTELYSQSYDSKTIRKNMKQISETKLVKRRCLNNIERSNYQNDYVRGEIIFNLITKSYQTELYSQSYDSKTIRKKT